MSASVVSARGWAECHKDIELWVQVCDLDSYSNQEYGAIPGRFWVMRYIGFCVVRNKIGHAGDDFAKSDLWGLKSVSCHVWNVTSVAFAQQRVFCLGNYGTNLAGGFTVEGLQVLARRYPDQS